MRVIIGRDLPQSTIDEIIDESDIIGDHKVWKDGFLALSEESTAGLWYSAVDHRSSGMQNNNKRREVVRVYLKRSRSADDFDLVRTRSLDKMYSFDGDGGSNDDQFKIEKAKSVRKATKQFG